MVALMAALSVDVTAAMVASLAAAERASDGHCGM